MGHTASEWTRRSFLQTAGTALSVGVAGSRSAWGAAKITLKAGHDSPTTHPYQTGLNRFAEVLQQQTNGEIAVQTFPDAQLGNERDLTEGVRLGTIGVAVSSSAALSVFVKEMQVFNLPYITRGRDHQHRVLAGLVGDTLARELEAKAGGKIVGWFATSQRNVWNRVRPIEKPADLQGLKIRTRQSRVEIETYNALGAKPTPIAFGELYTALQTGVVDGGDNGVVDVLTLKFYEVTKYFSFTRHVTSPAALFVSKRIFDTLSPAQRTAILEAGREAQVAEEKAQDELETRALGELKAKGLIVNDIPDLRPFHEKVAPVYQKFETEIGKQLIDEMLKA